LVFQKLFNTFSILRNPGFWVQLKVYSTKRQVTQGLALYRSSKTNYQPNANLRVLEKLSIIGILRLVFQKKLKLSS